jgi:hypothetical protein
MLDSVALGQLCAAASLSMLDARYRKGRPFFGHRYRVMVHAFRSFQARMVSGCRNSHSSEKSG